MSLIISVLLLLAGLFTVAMMSCFAMAKLADERKEKIFASFCENCGSGDVL
jgi:hypothetical protein